MKTANLESEQLDEGIKDTLSSIANMFKKKKVKQLRTKYLRSGNTRVFATEVPNGEVQVDVYEGKTLKEAFTVDSVRYAEEVFDKYYGKDQGFEVVKRPTEFRNIASRFGIGAGAGIIGVAGVDAGIAGAFVISNIISAGSVSGVALVGVGISLVLNLVVGTGGWFVIKASQKKRSEIEQEKEIMYSDLTESAPPTKAAEEWIQKNKERFKKQYGDNWEEIMYATSWKMHKKGEL